LAEVKYPTEWSKKRNRELQPHLSTLDSMTVATDLSDIYLRHAFGIDAQAAQVCWVRRAVIKASSTPTTDLHRVPVSLALLGTEASSDGFGGHASRLACSAGSMTVELVVNHPIGKEGSRAAMYADIDDALGSAEQRHYVTSYKQAGLTLTDIVAEREDCAAATMTLSAPKNGPVLGLSARYEPFVSMMYALISAAQMSQVVLYQCDHITRETSNNMWLRRLAMEMERPVPIDGPFLIQTGITRTTVLSMKGSRWRSANFTTEFPGLRMEYNLAHELAPDKASISSSSEARES
jgi:hypothetical protein